MIYTINLKLAFEDYDDLNDLIEEAERRYLLAVNVNEGQENEELGFFEVRESYHDDASRTTPDIILARWEVGRGKVFP